MLTSRQILAARAEELRRNMTRHERKLWYEFLYDHELSFRPQKVVGNYILDFYCRKAHLSIELDGSQHYEERQRKYDEVRTTFLETRGIYELRFSNADIDESFEGVCIRIDQALRARRPDIHGPEFEILLKKR
ncbi:MAG: endonuclease domain-containing protein [Eggerthellaceae bacterium]|nr:endonuclease domain-containing protein [Eggerthellaceae bacterium]